MPSSSSATTGGPDLPPGSRRGTQVGSEGRSRSSLTKGRETGRVRLRSRAHCPSTPSCWWDRHRPSRRSRPASRTASGGGHGQAPATPPPSSRSFVTGGVGRGSGPPSPAGSRRLRLADAWCHRRWRVGEAAVRARRPASGAWAGSSCGRLSSGIASLRPTWCARTARSASRAEHGWDSLVLLNQGCLSDAQAGRHPLSPGAVGRAGRPSIQPRRKTRPDGLFGLRIGLRGRRRAGMTPAEDSACRA